MELLAPAGSMDKMKMAFLYGADAVYLGGKSFGLRAFSDNFSNEELKEAVDYAHARGKHIHVTVNIFPHNDDLKALPDYLVYLPAIGYLLIAFTGQAYPGNQLLLWIGVAVIIIAILICGKAYGRLSSGKSGVTPKKGILLAVMAGIAIMFFYGLVVKSLDPQYVTGGTGTLSPYTGVFFFALGVLVSTPIFNSIAMRNPVSGNKVTMKDYFAGSTRTHLIGVLGGLIWMGGMVVSFMGAGAANPAISYALSNASPVVAMIWGVFVWKEFKGAPNGTNSLISSMFVLFVLGLVLITLSN